MSRTFAVVLAGGRGERLWPLSTSARPKQFLPLLSGRSLLRATAERVAPLVDPRDLFVVVPKRYHDLVAEELSLPPGQILLEPEGRNTALALATAALVLFEQDPEGVMIALPADHFVAEVERFRELIRAGTEAARRYAGLVTLGIAPDHPATGYGYIRRGELLGEIQGIPLYKAERFVEKPDRARAEAFLAEGRCFWNSGMFVWRLDVFLQALSTHMPELHAQLLGLRGLWGTRGWEDRLFQVYSSSPPVSVDHGVMEKARNVLVLPADIGWCDLGDWSSLAKLLPRDDAENAVHAKLVGIETEGCVVYAEDPDRLVATLGIRDLVIVETKEALLVVPKDRIQEIRRLLTNSQRS